MSDALFRIVYCSRHIEAGPVVGPDSIRQILATSRRNNAACGVTGALLHSQGLFVQTLEGSFDAVQSVFERIQLDPRHDEIVVLTAGTVDDRLFADWSMAAADPADPIATHATLERALLTPNSNASAVMLAMLEQVVTYVPA